MDLPVSPQMSLYAFWTRCVIPHGSGWFFAIRERDSWFRFANGWSCLSFGPTGGQSALPTKLSWSLECPTSFLESGRRTDFCSAIPRALRLPKASSKEQLLIWWRSIDSGYGILVLCRDLQTPREKSQSIWHRDTERVGHLVGSYQAVVLAFSLFPANPFNSSI